MDQDFDARGINTEQDAPACPQCGTTLRTGGPGRKPVYCSRSCSSKAYRQRRAQSHQDVVADALVSSRVEIPDAPEPGHQHLLELAAAIGRSAARYLQALDQARLGHGDDPRCNQALQRLEASATAATQRMLRQAHFLRYEMVTARLAAERAAAPAAPAGETTRVETSPAPAGETTPEAPATAPAPNVDSSRVETAAPAPAIISPRVETAAPAPDLDSSRVETAAPAPTTDPGQLRLALADERTAHSPLARALGAPTDTWSINDSDLVVEGWNTVDLFAVRDPDRRLLGWVEALGDGWGTYIKGRLVIDATDGAPWLSTDAPHAVALLRVARDQHLT
ncbi:hypothetical protein ACH4E7_43455 [Kitasatospora sp. NPDC018058]|uniref:hypothetical protein n=1 Tax=Kitasatospora sp. NPDC018058 TaxID=3364025 RepID=UPI0037C0AA22